MISIHGYIFGKSYPLFFALLKSKKQETYVRLFKLIQNKIPPKDIIIDFKKVYLMH